MLDRKIDDGKPLTGSVIAISDYTYSDAGCCGNNVIRALSVPKANCVDSTNNAYVTSGGACEASGGSNVDMLLPAPFAD